MVVIGVAVDVILVAATRQSCRMPLDARCWRRQKIAAEQSHAVRDQILTDTRVDADNLVNVEVEMRRLQGAHIADCQYSPSV